MGKPNGESNAATGCVASPPARPSRQQGDTPLLDCVRRRARRHTFEAWRIHGQRARREQDFESFSGYLRRPQFARRRYRSRRNAIPLPAAIRATQYLCRISYSPVSRSFEAQLDPLIPELIRPGRGGGGGGGKLEQKGGKRRPLGRKGGRERSLPLVADQRRRRRAAPCHNVAAASAHPQRQHLGSPPMRAARPLPYQYLWRPLGPRPQRPSGPHVPSRSALKILRRRLCHPN